MLKYQNALDKNDNIIHISSITTVNKQTLSPFRCVGCHTELIPALGNTREHHFKHKSNTHCSFETYLHKAAKLAVFKGLVQQKKIETIGYLPVKVLPALMIIGKVPVEIVVNEKQG